MERVDVVQMSAKNTLVQCNKFFRKYVQSIPMGFLSNFKKDLQAAKAKKAAQINGKTLKGLLKQFKEERDRVEKETGVRPQIDATTKMYMQKILNVWISEGKEIDEEKFWTEVDYNRQFSHPAEFYEIKR